MTQNTQHQNNQQTGPFRGRFFDGKTADEHIVTVAFDPDGISMDAVPGEGEGSWHWLWRDVRLEHLGQDRMRLNNLSAGDATLVVPLDAASQINQFAPIVLSGKRERRRLLSLVTGLTIVSALIGWVIFIGVPVASGPLARATPKEFEIKMGETMASQASMLFQICDDAEPAIRTLMPVINEIAETGEVGFPITFQFIDWEVPNAFALPGGQVMATKGLLKAVEDDQEAFMGVITHELGHVRARDSMQAFYQSNGLGVVLTVVIGGPTLAQQTVLISSRLNQLRYSRGQETRADETAYEIMLAMGLDPAALARSFEAIEQFSEPLTEGFDADVDVPEWLLTHPDTDGRIKRALEQSRPSTRRLFTDEQWATIRTACGADEVEKHSASDVEVIIDDEGKVVIIDGVEIQLPE